MAKDTRSRAELLAEIKFLRQDRWITIIGSNINTFIRALKWIAIMYFVYLSIQSLAGHTTFANIALQVLTDFRFERIVSYTLGGGGIIYGLRERRLRKQAIEQLETRATSAEKLIDSRRSSSLLTVTGETNPVDQGDI